MKLVELWFSETISAIGLPIPKYTPKLNMTLVFASSSKETGYEDDWTLKVVYLE